MEQKKYVLCIDDTGYDFLSKDKRSVKYHVGILIPEDVREDFKSDLFLIMSDLKRQIAVEVNEIHACEVKGLVSSNMLKENAFVRYLEKLYKLVVNPKYDVKIFVSSGFVNKNVPIKNPVDIQEEEFTRKVIVHKKEFDPSTELEKFLCSKNITERKDMMRVYYLANSYLKHFDKDAYIARIYCDEGIRKRGKEIHIKDGTTLKFISSKESLLVQAVDNIAWSINRGSIVAVDKVQKGVRKPNGVDRIATFGVLKMSEQIIASSKFLMKDVPISDKWNIVVDDVKIDKQTQPEFTK